MSLSSWSQPSCLLSQRQPKRTLCLDKMLCWTLMLCAGQDPTNMCPNYHNEHVASPPTDPPQHCSGSPYCQVHSTSYWPTVLEWSSHTPWQSPCLPPSFFVQPNEPAFLFLPPSLLTKSSQIFQPNPSEFQFSWYLHYLSHHLRPRYYSDWQLMALSQA